MKALKKILAVLSAGTMIIGGAAMSSMIASADASMAPRPEQHIALRCWTEFFKEYGIDFTELEYNRENVELIINTLKENNISATEFCSKSIAGMDNLAKMMKDFGVDDSDINIHFISYMWGMRDYIKSDDCSRCYDPSRPENADNVKELMEKGFTWNGKRWDFDVDAYLQANGRLDKPADVLENEKVEGDINGDGVFDISDVAALQKALSTSTATLDMDVNGDGKVNVFDAVAIKRMLSENLGSDVKSV